MCVGVVTHVREIRVYLLCSAGHGAGKETTGRGLGVASRPVVGIVVNNVFLARGLRVPANAPSLPLSSTSLPSPSLSSITIPGSQLLSFIAPLLHFITCMFPTAHKLIISS